jgi:uncharacterized protein YmfQ (DUF2313 family)
VGLVWDAIDRVGSTMWAYFFAFAISMELLEERLCQLSQEIYCREAIETTDLWNLDYGVPDDCIGLLACEKKVWKGGATCDYFSSILNAHGWHVSDCVSLDNRDVAFAGCAYAGCAYTGPRHEVFEAGSNLGEGALADNDFYRVGGLHREYIGDEWVILPYVGKAFTWVLTIDLSQSASWTEIIESNPPSAAGCAYAGCAYACSPNPDQVICLIEKLKPAHTKAIVKFINP